MKADELNALVKLLAVVLPADWRSEAYDYLKRKIDIAPRSDSDAIGLAKGDAYLLFALAEFAAVSARASLLTHTAEEGK